MIQRFPNNPLISPTNVKPSRPDFEVLCAFNPGAASYEGKKVLLVRVAERPLQEKGYISTRQIQRLQLGLDTMEHEAPTGAGKVIRVLNMLQILLHGAR